MNPEDEKLSVKEFAQKHKGKRLEQGGTRGAIIGYGEVSMLICPENEEGWSGREDKNYTFLIPEEGCSTALCYGVFLDEPYELLTEESRFVTEELANEEFVKQNLDVCFHVDYVEGEWYLVGFDENDNGMLFVNTEGAWENNQYYKDNRILTDCSHYGNKPHWSWDIAKLTRIDKINPIPQESSLEDIPVVSEEDLLAPLLEDYLKRFSDVKKIILNGGATIVILKTGEKGIVKPEKNENVDIRVGILEGILKARKKFLSDKVLAPTFSLSGPILSSTCLGVYTKAVI